MKRTLVKPTSKIKLLSQVAAGALLATAVALPAASLTEAGQPIQNQATATYQDSLGNDYVAQSNLATVEVRQVYFATLGSDGAKTVASNQTVYFQHILTNTGNGEDTYTISVADTTPGAGSFADLRVYVDLNDNGTVDAGEPEATTVTLNPNDPASRDVSLVVAGLTPSAVDGDTFSARLTATSANGVVTDLTDGAGGADLAQNTNDDVATISGDAVLNVIKSSVHDTANNEITYTITVTNTGNQPAEDVVIFDALPAGTTFESVTQSGFGTAIDADDVNAANANLSETVLAIDLNADGDTSDVTEADFGLDLDNDAAISSVGAENGVYGFDDVLDPGVSIELNFTVSYDPTSTFGAGDTILNRAYVSGDVDGDLGTSDGSQGSNLVTDTVPQIYGVTVSDTGADGDDDVNDGGDDDDTVNDVQEVDSVQAGELVYFTHTIRNGGNGIDTFELDVRNSASFPTGTSFTIWNASSTVQLLNTNGEGGVDTGPMNAGETLTVTVHAQLPPGSGNAANATYDLFATSSADPASSPVNDDAAGLILTIAAPTVDLSNGGAADADGVPANRHAYNNDGDPETTLTANPGDSVTFPLVIENDSLVADSFQLSAGGSFIASTLGALPSGWAVTFRDSGGSVITTTPSIAPGAELEITAEVQIPSIETQAIADRTFVIDDTGNDTVDGNADSDGDYGIFFRVVSVNSGASDIKLDAVDVLPNEEITLLQNNSGQVQPNGSIDYPHTLQNDGNTTEAVTLSAANGTAGWSNNLLVDTDGDGTADTAFATLSPGDTVYYVDATGTLVAGTLGAGNTLELDPGESLNFVVRAFAPTSAPNGQLDILTVTATYNGGTDDVQNIDRSEVVEAQLRMVKTASVNADCEDGAGNGIETMGDLGPDLAFTETASAAAPGECIVWQVVATNAGVDTITDVDITDAVPAFSDYVADTLRVCVGDAGLGITANCTFTSLTDGTGDDEGEVSASDIRFPLGQGATPQVAGGAIASGASVTVRFATDVE